MLCEERMIITETMSALLVPQKKSNISKTYKFCTNCGMINHDVDTCRKKKKHIKLVATEATQPSQKP